LPQASDRPTLICYFLILDGGVQKKSKKPVSKRDQMANIGARQAIANGDLATAEIELKKQKDLRTIYVRFEVFFFEIIS
jgi:hypothetical protein